MKTLIQKIKDSQLIARKARDTVKATLLTTLIGEAEMVGKSDGNRASTDVEVLQVVRKFEKNMRENEKIYQERNMPIQLWNIGIELDIIKEFLPQKISDGSVENDINSLLSAFGLAKDMKSMGAIGKELRQTYGDKYDGQQVSNIFKRMIA